MEGKQFKLNREKNKKTYLCLDIFYRFFFFWKTVIKNFRDEIMPPKSFA